MHALQRTILVVEDDLESRLLLTRILEHAGFRVVQANHGAAALEAIASNPGATVILDLHLPIVDGVHVLYELWRSKREEITARTVVASADLEVEEKVRAFGVGAVLKKPYSKEQLFAAMETVHA